jgi:AcrR family transcriptional regulator
MTNVIVKGGHVTGPAVAIPPRQRLVTAAAELIRRQGPSGTGMREIVERAEAPRGSLQHYFPGGKDQLVVEAIAAASDFVVGKIDDFLAFVPDASPGDLFAAMAFWWRDLYHREGYAEGCPFAATTTDVAASSPALLDAVRTGLDAWRAVIERGLANADVPPDRIPSLTMLMMSAIEGALILARSYEDTAALDAIVTELRPVLDGAVRGRQGRRR